MKEYKITINGNEYKVGIKNVENDSAQVTVNGTEYEAQIKGSSVAPKTPKIVQQPTVNTQSATVRATPIAPAAPAGGSNAVKSPLPGVILDVMVREGDTVSVGQKVMVLEAMKMENNIESTIAGKVLSVAKGKGDSVLEGDVLITIG